MKKKNTAKKAVLPALLAVLCSTAALTSVSYAWFTMGDKAEVGQIDVNVQAADGMQISANAADWKSVLPLSDLIAQSSNKMLQGKEILPVSTVGTVNKGVQEMFLGQVQKDGSVLAKADTENYIQFDLYIKVDEGKKLNLDAGSFVKSSVAEKGTHLASRVSFVDLGSDAQASKAKELGAEVNNAKAVIWEPNADIHTEEAKLNHGAVDGTKDSKEGISSVETVEGKEYTKITTAPVSTIQTNFAETGTATANELLSLEAGVNKIRVFIWLEGQDIDCANDISGSGLQVGLYFDVDSISTDGE